ncbi:MAG: sodium:calcium antiporter, partial [Gemmatimonadetes bacterium]|nr:sodium:calcium antiporter [Gemmatimonadota bacterium]
MIDPLLILAGTALLYFGGERLIDDASEVARGLGMTPLVVGLTVVAFATSSPELAASLAAALAGTPEVAFGNVVGSNIANLGLILGATALVSPLVAKARFLHRELPFLLAASVGAVAIVLDGRIGRFDAALLLGAMALYLWWMLREPPAEIEEIEEDLVLWFSRTDWRLRRAERDVGEELLGYEEELLTSLFEDGDEVLLSDLR